MEMRIYLERKAAVVKELSELMRFRNLKSGNDEEGNEFIAPKGKEWNELKELVFLELLATLIKQDNAQQMEPKKKTPSAVYRPPTAAAGKPK